MLFPESYKGNEDILCSRVKGKIEEQVKFPTCFAFLADFFRCLVLMHVTKER